MKKVALISDGWKRLITYAWTEGAMERIREYDEDVCLYQFNSYGNWSRDKLNNDGEYNIYNLPDLSQYDGILLDCNNIADKVQLNRTIRMIRESGVPTVSITMVIDGFYYAGIDNRAPIRELMDHLYHEHGCRKFIYAGGPKENYENSLRMEAFTESLHEFGIEATSDMFLYGDYDYETGVRYITEIVEQERVPDVFVCANDNIAAGICAKAEKLGLRVPDDFLVTGFDNLDKAAFFRPQITTVAHNRESIAHMAIDILFDVWAGKQPPMFHFAPTQCIMAESCGCPNNHMVDYREYVRDQLIYSIHKQEYDELLMDLEGRMASCTTFTDIFREMSQYMSTLECDGFYIVIDKKLFKPDITTEFSKNGYDMENMVVGYAAEGNAILDVTDVKELHAYMDKNGARSNYLFTAIHFRDQTVGYSILKNGRFLYENPYFYDLHNSFVAALENLFKQQQLESSNAKMKELYNRDAMTGLYNRVAYNEMIKPQFARYCEQGVICALMFFDVDYFKEINDTKGHEFGDLCLKQIANALMKYCPHDGYVYRFGGDEFALFYPYATEESVASFVSKLEKELTASDISISTGVIFSDPKDVRTMDEYLAMADKKMYEAKSKRKRTRPR